MDLITSELLFYLYGMICDNNVTYFLNDKVKLIENGEIWDFSN